jgi:hypothetical protein
MRKKPLLRLACLGAAVSVSLLLGYPAQASTVASAGVMPAAVSHGPNAPQIPDDHPCCQYPWRVIKVSSAYDTQGGWFDCAPIVDNDGANATWACNDSIATGNSVTGTVNVSDGTISTSVGFSVTQTFTRGQSYSLAPGSDWFGEFESANVYSTKTVTQGEQVCYLTPPLDCTWLGIHATAYAHRWIGWTYQHLRYADD